MRLIAFCTAALLAACATATPYQPLNRGVGYQDQRLESNRYRVSFNGNSATPRQTVENYVLYRAAELTLANGYDYFIIDGGGTEGAPRNSGGSVGFGIGGFSFGSHGGLGIGIGTSTGSGSTEYSGSAIVSMFKGRKPDDDARAYTARDIRDNLEANIQRPKTG